MNNLVILETNISHDNVKVLKIIKIQPIINDTVIQPIIDDIFMINKISVHFYKQNKSFQYFKKISVKLDRKITVMSMLISTR